MDDDIIRISEETNSLLDRLENYALFVYQYLDKQTHADVQFNIAIEELEKTTSKLLKNSDYKTAIEKMAAIKPVVDKYFKDVRILDDDPEIAWNRQQSLKFLQWLFDRIADFKQIKKSRYKNSE